MSVIAPTKNLPSLLVSNLKLPRKVERRGTPVDRSSLEWIHTLRLFPLYDFINVKIVFVWIILQYTVLLWVLLPMLN